MASSFPCWCGCTVYDRRFSTWCQKWLKHHLVLMLLKFISRWIIFILEIEGLVNSGYYYFFLALRHHWDRVVSRWCHIYTSASEHWFDGEIFFWRRSQLHPSDTHRYWNPRWSAQSSSWSSNPSPVSECFPYSHYYYCYYCCWLKPHCWPSSSRWSAHFLHPRSLCLLPLWAALRPSCCPYSRSEPTWRSSWTFPRLWPTFFPSDELDPSRA